SGSGKGSAQIDLTAINITGCGPPDRPQRNCLFQKGTNAQMTLPFIPAGPSSVVRTKVHGILAGIPIPFPLPNEDGCSPAGGGLTCPLTPNQLVTYQTQLPVSKNYPSLSLKVRWQLEDENKRDIVCIEFPVQLR
ncbi:unnamed protein product, partial [Meganyctiphanes norvegica]